MYTDCDGHYSMKKDFIEKFNKIFFNLLMNKEVSMEVTNNEIYYEEYDNDFTLKEGTKNKAVIKFPKIYNYKDRKMLTNKNDILEFYINNKNSNRLNEYFDSPHICIYNLDNDAMVHDYEIKKEYIKLKNKVKDREVFNELLNYFITHEKSDKKIKKLCRLLKQKLNIENPIKYLNEITKDSCLLFISYKKYRKLTGYNIKTVDKLLQ